MDNSETIKCMQSFGAPVVLMLKWGERAQKMRCKAILILVAKILRLEDS